MEWKYINDEKDIEYLQQLYGDFQDSELIQFAFESGNYIDDDLIGYETNVNNLHIIFQRMDRNPFSIEIIFEGMKQIVYEAPLNNEYSAEISFAKFVKTEEYIYWTVWKDFNPLDKEHLLLGDYNLIKSCKAKWRVIS